MFKEMSLPIPFIEALTNAGFENPTPIQQIAIPLALEGYDVLGSAGTGTGKTLAFGIPLIDHVVKNQNHQALILTPTRELAQQVQKAIHSVLYNQRIRTALLIGGEPYGKQISQLRSNPKIIIGTPGRIIDNVKRGSLDLTNISFLVLDETDRMFDMGFGVQLDDIMKFLKIKHQTLMFSATFPDKVIKLAQKYLNNPQRVSIKDAPTPINLDQQNIRVKESEKYDHLLTELDTREGTVIVFVKTKMGAERLANKLVYNNHLASAIHGDLHQQKRERVMRDFRSGKYRIMVATDIAARGIDVQHVKHVINYDLPHCPEDYIHRIGRTARAGSHGSALNLISSQDQKYWYSIERLMNNDSSSSFPSSNHRPLQRQYRDRDRNNSSRDRKGKNRRFRRAKSG